MQTHEFIIIATLFYNIFYEVIFLTLPVLIDTVQIDSKFDFNLILKKHQLTIFSFVFSKYKTATNVLEFPKSPSSITP